MRDNGGNGEKLNSFSSCDTPYASAAWRLLPSPFSRAFFPILSFGVLIISAVYGMLTGRFNSLTAVLDALYYGIAQSAPLFVLYVVAAQFYYSLTFVF